MAARRLIPILIFVVLAPCAIAQSDSDVPLGDVARTLRSADAPSQHDIIIDNDNLPQALEDSHAALDGTPVFSAKGGSDKFQMSSPDGTCSLSFNANATALITDPVVNRELPGSELAKLDGPAIINNDTLEVSIYNGTGWNLTEVTIGLTVIRRDNLEQPEASFSHAAKFFPAAMRNVEDEPAENSVVNLGNGMAANNEAAKRSDTTVLYHLKGIAGPLKTTTFREIMASALEPGTEWHWAIVQAKGVPPKAAPVAPSHVEPLNIPVLPALPQPEVKPPAVQSTATVSR
jgi:hypothetical protein